MANPLGQSEDGTPKDRKSGVLLHISSLPSRFGIGDMGPEAHTFVTSLKKAGQSYWQMLPVVPTGFADSPYQSPAALAGNPMLISPAPLIELGLLTEDDTVPLRTPRVDSVDFQALIRTKSAALEKAARVFRANAAIDVTERFLEFRDEHGAVWLDNAALFTAIKSSVGGIAWSDWPTGLANREVADVGAAREDLAEDIEIYEILQFLFFEQWNALRETARRHGVGLVGDLPLYVAHDSADVWANPASYLLDEGGMPEVVAGVPPDYFSATGQRWGNPIFDWAEMASNGFSWWRDRMTRTRAMFDVVRIDHFRGINGYWAIPADEETATNGEWQEGPGRALLEAVGIEPGDTGILAEDLGFITPDVIALRDDYRLPGMRVAQFGFDDAPDKPIHHPDAYPSGVWAYTGTHDNNTTEGWFWNGNPAKDPKLLDCGRRTLLDEVGEPVSWGLVKMVAESAAGTAIFPVQDLLGLGAEARMNTPGTTEGNWRWRLRAGGLTEEMFERLRHLTEASGRSRTVSAT